MIYYYLILNLLGEPELDPLINYCQCQVTGVSVQCYQVASHPAILCVFCGRLGLIEVLSNVFESLIR